MSDKIVEYQCKRCGKERRIVGKYYYLTCQCGYHFNHVKIENNNKGGK